MNMQGIIWLIVSGVENNYEYRWMTMLDFIYMDSADQFVMGRERQFKMKIYVSSGIRTHTTPDHDRKVSVLDILATLVRYQVDHL